MRCSAWVRSIGPSRCCYRRRAIEYEYEYEYRTLTRPEYEGILFRDGQNTRFNNACTNDTSLNLRNGS
jgi:hypothetical protein